MKVKLLTSMAGAETRHAGDEYECDAAEAARLIEAGYAEAIEPKVERATKPEPKAKRG
jgi:hypothetical protein